jgi:hypothetical protein
LRGVVSIKTAQLEVFSVYIFSNSTQIITYKNSFHAMNLT